MASPAMILPALGLLGGDGFAGVAAGAASGAEDSALEEHLAAGGELNSIADGPRQICGY
ncbi:MAG: hypothetical protein P8Y09_12620 [Deltaproteobacteria bacterium]